VEHLLGLSRCGDCPDTHDESDTSTSRLIPTSPLRALLAIVGNKTSEAEHLASPFLRRSGRDHSGSGSTSDADKVPPRKVRRARTTRCSWSPRGNSKHDEEEGEVIVMGPSGAPDHDETP
jgi:hypothetical protein